MPYPLPLTRTEAYLAYKAGVIQQSDLKPSLAVPRNGIDAWLAYWTGLSFAYPVKNVGKNILSSEWEIGTYNSSTGAKQEGTNSYRTAEKVAVQPDTTYIVSRNSVGIAMNFVEYDANGDFIAYTYKAIGSPITTSHTTKFITMSRGQSGGIDKMMLEEGETVSQYAPYTGEPLILQEEEAYIAYLSGVVNEYPEKCLRRVGAYLRYLISARWGRPDHPLNREELYLSLIKTQFIPSGEPSSDIEIDGTAKAAFVDVKMYGDTFQQSYNGRNLIDMPIVNGSRNGVTWVVNDDGSITLNGTATANVGIRAEGARIPAVAGETYTLSATGLQGIVNFGYKNSSSGADILVVTPSSPVKTVQVTKEMLASADRLDMFFSAGKSFNNQRVTLQLEKGSTATSYEPFVGGHPSPSPDYPQPIQTVTGRQVVEVQGKNLLKLNDGATTLGGVSITTTNGTVNLKGAATSGAQGYYVTIGITASEPMVFSTNKSGTTSGLHIKLQYERGGMVYYPSVDSSLSLQAGDIIQQMYLIVANGSTLDGSFSPMLEKGSTATSYEPYTKQTYPINLGSLELCKIGNYQDYIYKDGEDWKVHKTTGRHTYTGEENWIQSGRTSQTVFAAGTDISSLGIKRSETDKSLMDYFIFGAPTIAGYFDLYNGSESAQYTALYLDRTKVQDLTAVKSWISTNRPTICYILTTPTDTVITDPNLIAQLEALVNGGAENGTTYIKVNATDPNLPGLLVVEAPKYE